MLRRAQNVTVTHRPGFWTGKGPMLLEIGRKAYHLGKMSKPEFEERQRYQLKHPLRIALIDDRTYWLFQNKTYWENDGLIAEEVHALLVTREQRNRRQIDRAVATVAVGSSPRTNVSRRAIPDDVKQYVWTRDQGRCQSCGSTTELQFDHIIPLAMNGSNDENNLQLLCGPCNRSKGAGLTTRR